MKPLIKTRRSIYNSFKRISGSSYAQKYQDLKRRQFLSWPENTDLQRKALTRLLTTAYWNIPFYRKPFQDAGLIGPEGDIILANFPHLAPLTKRDINQNQDKLLNQDTSISRRRIMKLHSGGTTGNPVYVSTDLQYWDWYLAHTHLIYEWMGLEFGMPYFYFWGALQDQVYPTDPLKLNFWLETIQNRHLLNCYHMSDDLMKQYIQEVNEKTTHQHIVGYTQELYELACFSIRYNLPITRTLKGILVTTSHLSEKMRATIESVFHCPVYSRYGCREIGDVACECSFKTGFHINPLYSYVEIVDEAGHLLPPGEEGRILITGLQNDYMPLIRYEVQDSGIMKPPGPCQCRRNWHTLGQITGRLNERLVTNQGSFFSLLFLDYCLEPLTDLLGQQLHQTSPYEVEVHLVSPNPNYLQEHAEEINLAHQRLLKSTENHFHFFFKQVDAVEKAPSGKPLLVVNKMRGWQTQEIESEPANFIF